MIDAPFDYEAIIFHILNGLDSDYKEILIVICARNSPISFEELHVKHSDYEVYLKRESLPFDITSIIINFTNEANSSNKGKIHKQQDDYLNNHSGDNMQQCNNKSVNKSD